MSLIVRKEQLAAHGRVFEEHFRVQLAEHLRVFFPVEAAKLGAEGVLEAIDHGIERARDHGVVTERGLCKYLDLMFVFGRDFDLDPGLPWAGRVLRARPVPDIDLLFALGLANADQAKGYFSPDSDHPDLKEP